jgi:bacillopeptidase F
VTVTQDTSAYPDIPAGQVRDNNTAYEFEIADTVPCGEILDFQLAVTTDQGSYTFDFSIQASIPQPPTNTFFDDFEGGVNGWTTGGTNNTWAQTTEEAYSPTHSWTDSPGGNYVNNTNSWLQSPVLDLTGKTDTAVSAWYLHSLEPGFDFAYLEYSTDGGATYNPTPLAEFNGAADNWYEEIVHTPMLDNQPNARLRYRMYSDSGVVDDGIYVDDFAVSYVPIVCEAPPTAVSLTDFGAEDSNSTANGTALAIVAIALAGAVVFASQRKLAGR